MDSMKETVTFRRVYIGSIFGAFLVGVVFSLYVLEPIFLDEGNRSDPMEKDFNENLQSVFYSRMVPDLQEVEEGSVHLVPSERVQALYSLSGMQFVLVGRDLTSTSSIAAGVYAENEPGVWKPVLDLPAVFKANELVDDGHLEPIALVRGFDGELYLDVSNGLGAGSGEGSLTRFRLGLTGEDLPIVAESVGCWYYLPEAYSPELTSLFPTDTCFVLDRESPWPERMDIKPPMDGEFAYRMLNLLAEGMYEQVAPYISDEMYSMIVEWNDDAAQLTRTELLKRGCEINGLVCEQVFHFQEATTVPEGGEGATWFDVEIASASGPWDVIGFQIGVMTDPYTGRYLLRVQLPYTP